MKPEPLPDHVEVEIGTYCNRTCAWCPNHWHERGQQRRFMAEETWRSVVDDLARHRFRGRFAFHNYNEPLADPQLDARIVDARAKLKRAQLVLYTNGDFLTADRARSLVRLGVDHVNVTLYPRDEDAFRPVDPRMIDRFLTKIKARGGKRTDFDAKLVHGVHLRAGGRSMYVLVRLPRIEQYNDRVGAVGLVQLQKKAVRTAPCALPKTAAAVDVDGNLKLCCHIYDVTTQPSGSVAHVRDGFIAAWRSTAMGAVRRRLLAADFAGLPCATCTDASTSQSANTLATNASP